MITKEQQNMKSMSGEEQKAEFRNSEVSDAFLLRQLRCERTFIESGLKNKYDEALRRVIEKEMKA